MIGVSCCVRKRPYNKALRVAVCRSILNLGFGCVDLLAFQLSVSKESQIKFIFAGDIVLLTSAICLSGICKNK